MPKQKLPPDPRDYYVHNDVSLEELAALYKSQKGCSLDNLKKRSRKENWAEQRHQNGTKTALKVDQKVNESKAVEIAASLSKLEQLRDATIDVHLAFMNNLKNQIQDIQNPYLFDGERTNSLFQTAMNNSVKVLMAIMRSEETKQPNGTPASSPIYQSIYKGGNFNSTSTGNFASKAILPLESSHSGSQEWEDDSSD